MRCAVGTTTPHSRGSLYSPVVSCRVARTLQHNPEHVRTTTRQYVDAPYLMGGRFNCDCSHQPRGGGARTCTIGRNVSSRLPNPDVAF